uniref:SH2 domain-containing protein n=1 Tax=Plectus sambesii TaxID=2011161 RepID=A0A914VZB6_9BILA
MYTNTSVPNMDLRAFDIELLNDLKVSLKAFLKKYEAFLKTLPALIESHSQARQFLEENQKRLCSSFQQLKPRLDTFDNSNAKETEQLLKRYSNEFSLSFRSNLHLISFGEKLKTLLMLGQLLQSTDDNQLNVLEENVLALRKLQTTQLEQSMIVTKQPPPVLMAGKCIETEVRWLANISPVSPSLRIRIIKADDAEKLISGEAISDEIASPASITENCTELLEYGDIWISHFNKKPLLKTVKKSWQDDGKQSSSGEDGKYVLLYEIAPVLGKGETSSNLHPIWTISHPFILISNSADYCDAFATVLWSRAFKDEKEIEWSTLSAVLNKVFDYLTGGTKRSLSESDLLYFRRKLGVRRDSDTVSLKRFSKNNVEPDVTFSFWSWFFHVCKIIKKNSLPYWEKGYLMGFDTKESIAKKISVDHKCCFLLRFSDSQLGSLSISRFDFDYTGEQRHTAFLLPPDQELYALVTLLDNFDQLKDIHYFRGKDLKSIDKKLLLCDPDLKLTEITTFNPTWKRAVLKCIQNI